MLLKQKYILYNYIQAIGLVEAFRYNDAALRSTIGCSDGKPYEKTY